MDIVIRKGIVSDAQGVVYVNTYTWLSTYKNIMPEGLLDNRVKSMEERVTKVTNSIKEKDNLYVAVDKDKIVGIVTYGPSRNMEYKDSGEIYSLYVLEEYQGFGIGKKLFFTAIKQLLDEGYNSMILNVLEGNKTIGFYEKYNGVKVATKKDLFGDVELQEIVMYFDNLESIIK